MRKARVSDTLASGARSPGSLPNPAGGAVHSAPPVPESLMKPPIIFPRLPAPSVLVVSAALAAAATLSADAQWTRFRGPNGSGVAPEGAAVPLEWSRDRNLAWSTELPGPGSSSPIIVGDRIFATCWSGYATPDGGDITKLVRHLVCLDAGDGAVRWTRTVPATQPEDPYEGFLREHGYASSTPASDGERVFVLFGKSGVFAWDLEGNELWHRDVGTLSNSRRWGSAASPIVHGDLVIVNAADEDRAIIAFDTRSGEEKWKSQADLLELAFGSPAVLAREDGRDEIIVAVPGELWALNSENGKLRWFAATGLGGNVCPSPLVDGETIFLTGGFPRTARVAVKAGSKGEAPADHLLWDAGNASYVPTPVLHDGRLHWLSDQGFAMCADARSGELVYKERVDALEGAGGRNRPVYASPVKVGDRIYCVTRHAGTVVLAAAPEFRILAHNVIEGDDTQFNGTPAIAGDTLVLRSDRAVHAIRPIEP